MDRDDRALHLQLSELAITVLPGLFATDAFGASEISLPTLKASAVRFRELRDSSRIRTYYYL